MRYIYAQVLQKNDSLELLLEITSDSKDKIDILLNLSDKLKNNNPEKALNYADEAFRLSESDGYQYGIVNSTINKAYIYWSLTDFKTAMEFAEKAKEISEEMDMQKELALSLRVIGLIYIELSNYEKSSKYFFKSLKIFEQIKDNEGVCKLLSDIGSVNFYQNSYAKALEYYFRSLNIAKEMKDRSGIARSLNNIAAVYEGMKDYEKAGKYFQEASIINRELGNKLWEGINYLNLGTVRLNLKDYDGSFKRLQQALSIFTELQSKILLARCHLNLANYFIETNNPDQGMEYATMALKEGEAQNLKQIIHDAADIIQKTYLQKGDKENAYKYIVLKYQMKDSLVLMENKAELTNLELQYEFDKREQQKQIEQQRKDLYILIVIISLLIALIVIILILTRLRVKAKNALLKQQKLEHQLEFRNKELATNVLSLMKKNEVLSAISDKLITIKNQAVKDETKDAINKISKEIQKTTEEEIYEEFELRFKQVHSDFYNKLVQRFPGLSPSEQRLCAFLRLNMTTKEISELTGQQPSSLETARYRLRKKLGITNSQVNLITFLSHI
jgi:tetratricopeptide (TPR) repeat protein